MHIAPLYEFAFITVFPQNILIFPPYFHKIYTFPPISKKKFCVLYLHFCFPPYFDHDAFMHHALHVLHIILGKFLN